MALSGHLTVTPEALKAQSTVVRDELHRMREYFDDLKGIFNGTSAFWIGEAGDAHRQQYSSKLSKVEEMLARYQEHVTDLEIMGGVYQEAEQTAASVADSLPQSMLD